MLKKVGLFGYNNNASFRLTDIKKIMVRKLKYKVVGCKTNRIVHHSYNKKNAEKWVKRYGRNQCYRIKKLKR